MCQTRSIWFIRAGKYAVDAKGDRKIYYETCDMARLTSPPEICEAPLPHVTDEIQGGCPTEEDCDNLEVDMKAQRPDQFNSQHDKCWRFRQDTQKSFDTGRFVDTLRVGRPHRLELYSPTGGKVFRPSPELPPDYPQGFSVGADGKLKPGKFTLMPLSAHPAQTAGFQQRAATIPQAAGTHSNTFVLEDQSAAGHSSGLRSGSPMKGSPNVRAGNTPPGYARAPDLGRTGRDPNRLRSGTPQDSSNRSQTLLSEQDIDWSAVDAFKGSYHGQDIGGVQMYSRRSTPALQGQAGGDAYIGQGDAGVADYSSQGYAGDQDPMEIDSSGEGFQGQPYGSIIHEGYVPMRNTPSRTGTPDRSQPPSRPSSRGSQQRSGSYHDSGNKGKARAYHFGSSGGGQ